MLVVLEGLDGAGKSTQVKRLRNYLESLFGDIEYIHFPRYDAPVYGDLISRFLRGDFGSNETVPSARGPSFRGRPSRSCSGNEEDPGRRRHGAA